MPSDKNVTEQERAWRDSGRDPLEAVPVIAESVEWRADDKGRLQLRKAVPPKPGIADWLARKFGFRSNIRVNLDEQGSLFWSMLDGESSLADIAVDLGEELGLSDEEARRATVVFAKNLMLRHLIYLKIPEV